MWLVAIALDTAGLAFCTAITKSGFSRQHLFIGLALVGLW